MSKFRKGQCVRIKKNLDVDILYGGSFFVDLMQEYRGRYARIIDVHLDEYECTRYNLDIDGGKWFWTADMLEPVTSQDDRLTVNTPSLETLEKYIVDTTRAIIDADEGRDQLETYELEFIRDLVRACCDHKIDRLLRKEDEE